MIKDYSRLSKLAMGNDQYYRYCLLFVYINVFMCLLCIEPQIVYTSTQEVYTICGWMIDGGPEVSERYIPFTVTETTGKDFNNTGMSSGFLNFSDASIFGIF